MEFQSEGRPLTTEAFDNAAALLGVDAASLWAVVEIEAKRCGYLGDRRPVILFERHKFHTKTKGKYSSANPDISNRMAGGYGRGGANQYERLAKAIELDREAALWSTSWGLGQIMGFNAEVAGFSSTDDMIKKMCLSEGEQLLGLAHFVISNGIQNALKVGNWSSFARGYNGENYQINNYDTRLRGAYQKFSVGPLPDLKVREAQLYLTYLGYDPGIIDGWFGSSTNRALNHFRNQAGLKESQSLVVADLEKMKQKIYG